MTYNEKLKMKLRGNLFGVGFFLIISTIVFVIRLNKIYWATPSLLEINNKLLAGDYITFIFFGMGIVALLLSLFLYLKFDNYYPQTQIKLFMAIGIFFLPYTIILVVIGIMKYIEKSKFKTSFFATSIITLLVLGLISSFTVSKLNEIEPLYISEYRYTAEYSINTTDHFEVEVVAQIRGSELLSVKIDALLNTNDLDPMEAAGEFYRMSISGSASCFNIPTTEAFINYELSCEEIKTNDTFVSLTADSFVNFTEFYFEYGHMDLDGILHRDGAYPMEVTSAVIIRNIYDEESND